MPKIPYLSLPDKPLTAPSQEHLPIADITSDIVLFKDGGASLVMESSSLNFGLLSEREQQAVVAAYAALMNSLSFSIQIVVRSQIKDITYYMKYLNECAQKIKNPLLASLMENYKSFINESIKKKNVLGKKFYIVVPFSPLELGIGKSIRSTLKKGALPFTKSFVIKKAKIVLYPKRDHLIRQAGRLGLRLRQLSSEELVDLYYSIYDTNQQENAKIKSLIQQKDV